MTKDNFDYLSYRKTVIYTSLSNSNNLALLMRSLNYYSVLADGKKDRRLIISDLE